MEGFLWKKFEERVGREHILVKFALRKFSSVNGGCPDHPTQKKKKTGGNSND